MSVKCGEKPAKQRKPWSQKDLDYLSDAYGLIPNRMIARHLERPETSISTTATSKLHLNLTDNFYTAAELARTLGLLNSNAIVMWVRNGWLKGSHNFCGNGRWLWCFVEEDIVECLRQRPCLVDLKTMDHHYFRSVVQEEWKKDPWYTTRQAASLLRVGHPAVKRYIERGWLLAAQKPVGALSYIIRRSSIEAFLANDPRPLYLHNARSQASRSRLEKLGCPSRIGILWRFMCPSCGQEVDILAPPGMVGLKVSERFISVYVNGRCFHSAKVDLTLPAQGV